MNEEREIVRLRRGDGSTIDLLGPPPNPGGAHRRVGAPYEVRVAVILVVVLSCGACYSWSKIGVPGQVCPASPDHVHVSADDERVRTWYASHRAPGMEVIGHITRIL